METARYLARAVLRRRLAVVVMLTLALGAMAGTAMGAFAAARRGSTSVDRLVAATHLPTNSVYSFADDPAAKYVQLKTLLASVGIRHRRIYAGGVVLTFPEHGSDFTTPGAGMLAEIDLEPGPQLRPVLLEGRLPKAADEMAVSKAVLANLDKHVGETTEIAWYHYADLETLGGGGQAAPAGIRRMRITGLARWPQELLRDARAEEGTIFESNSSLGLLPAAFWRDAGPDIAAYGVGAAVDATPSQSAALLAASGEGAIAVDQVVGADLAGLGAVRSAIELESAALVGFAVILAVAAAVLLGVAVGRTLNVDGSDRAVLDAIGVAASDRRRSAAVLSVGVGLLAALVGTVGAMVISTAAPFGYAAEAEIDTGLDVDRPVLLLGGALVLATTVGAALLSARSRLRPDTGAMSASGRQLGQPLPATVGLRLLGQSARSRTGAAIRVAALTAAAGTVAAVAAWTFAGSMHHLVTSPDLQGWEWDLAVGNYSQPVSAQAGAAALAANPDVAGFAGFNEQSVYLDRTFVPVAGIDGDAVRPRVLEGRAPAGSEEIALGRATLRRLGRDIGDRVRMSLGENNALDMTIVGVVTPPAGLSDGMALDWGGTTTLAALQHVMATSAEEPALQPYIHLVRLKPGVDVHSARDALQSDFPGTVNTARPTADIRTMRRVQSIPYLLASMIAAAGVVAVAIVLAQLARRRRRELALLRCMGFTGRQLVGVVLWQTTAFAAAALAVGIPVGVVLGRWLWRLAARSIGTDVGPTVPIGGIALALVGLLVLANLLALAPATRARRTHPALTLRAD